MSSKQSIDKRETIYYVMITGHRPQRISQRAVAKIKLRLLDKLQQLKELHPNIQIISGMALGVDTWFCEIAKQLSIPLNAYIPFKEQYIKWKESDKIKYFSLLDDAVKINITANKYSNNAYLKRNNDMVNDANECIAVWDGKQSGTGYTVAAVQKNNIPILIINSNSP